MKRASPLPHDRLSHPEHALTLPSPHPLSCLWATSPCLPFIYLFIFFETPAESQSYSTTSSVSQRWDWAGCWLHPFRHELKVPHVYLLHYWDHTKKQMISVSPLGRELQNNSRRQRANWRKEERRISHSRLFPLTQCQGLPFNCQ